MVLLESWRARFNSACKSLSEDALVKSPTNSPGRPSFFIGAFPALLWLGESVVFTAAPPTIDLVLDSISLRHSASCMMF